MAAYSAGMRTPSLVVAALLALPVAACAAGPSATTAASSASSATSASPSTTSTTTAATPAPTGSVTSSTTGSVTPTATDGAGSASPSTAGAGSATATAASPAPRTTSASPTTSAPAGTSGQGASAITRYATLPAALRGTGWHEVASTDLKPGEVGGRWEYPATGTPVCDLVVKVQGSTPGMAAWLGAVLARQVQRAPGLTVVRQTGDPEAPRPDTYVELKGRNERTAALGRAYVRVQTSPAGTVLLAMGTAVEADAAACGAGRIVEGLRLTGVEHPSARPDEDTTP